MPEKVLALPLSGLEVRNAILDRIGQSLQKDCFLSPNLAYDYFECHVTVSLKCHDVGRVAETKVDETVTEGENPDAALEAADAEFDMEPRPPNETRVESGQDIPVLTKAKDGRPEIKHIHYKRGPGRPRKEAV